MSEPSFKSGSVTEWFKVTVLKTVVGKPTVSSNLTASATSRDVAQSGRAPALGAGGRWFESSYPDHLILFCITCSHRLTVRTLVFHTSNRGSIPRASTNFLGYSVIGNTADFDSVIQGSSPCTPAKPSWAHSSTGRATDF